MLNITSLLSSVIFALKQQPKDRKLPPENDICDLCDLFTDTMTTESVVIRRNGEKMIVGDIHGNAFDLVRIFTKYGYPPQQSYLFLGDYVDRGEHSVEVLIILYSLKLLYPNNIDLLRGNHETPSLGDKYGFRNECKNKASELLYEKFMEGLRELPLCCILNDEIFAVHGGLSPEITEISELEQVEKPREIGENIIYTDLTWADPREAVGEKMYVPSKRGSGYYFSQEATIDFLKTNNLKFVVRSHEQCNDGYEYPFRKQILITIFSTTGYHGCSNTAAFLVAKPGFKPLVKTMEFVEQTKEELANLQYPSWLHHSTNDEL